MDEIDPGNSRAATHDRDDAEPEDDDQDDTAVQDQDHAETENDHEKMQRGKK